MSNIFGGMNYKKSSNDLPQTEEKPLFKPSAANSLAGVKALDGILCSAK